MRRIEEGDVVALAVVGLNRAPVGLVSEVDDGAIVIDLFSWLRGEFDGPQLLIRRGDVRATMWAETDQRRRRRAGHVRHGPARRVPKELAHRMTYSDQHTETN